jgi:pyrimidine-specific ribonucleoside hydrolase
MFHDPLAACIAVNREIAEFQEIEAYSQEGQWGSRPACGTGTFITTGVDKELFLETLAPAQS